MSINKNGINFKLIKIFWFYLKIYGLWRLCHPHTYLPNYPPSGVSPFAIEISMCVCVCRCVYHACMGHSPTCIHPYICPPSRCSHMNFKLACLACMCVCMLSAISSNVWFNQQRFIMGSILRLNLMIIKTPENVHKICFWEILRTFKCDPKIDLILTCSAQYRAMWIDLDV